MKKLGRSVGLTLIMMSFAACGQSGSGNGSSPAAPANTAVTDYSEKPADGSFTQTGTPESKEIPERFAQGCAKAGSDKPAKSSFDSQVRTGQTFEFKVQDSYSDGTIEADLIESVFQITSSELVDQGVLTILNGATDFPSGAYTKTCAIAENGKVSCTSTPQRAIRDYTKCQVVSQDQKSSEVAGQYQFKNGASVKAFKIVRVKKGQVMCQSKANAPAIMVGNGFESSIQIVSNDVVANTPVVCGGSVVFDYRVVRMITDGALNTAVKGGLMSSERTEMIQAPISN